MTGNENDEYIIRFKEPFPFTWATEEFAKIAKAYGPFSCEFALCPILYPAADGVISPSAPLRVAWRNVAAMDTTVVSNKLCSTLIFVLRQLNDAQEALSSFIDSAYDCVKRSIDKGTADSLTYTHYVELYDAAYWFAYRSPTTHQGADAHKAIEIYKAAVAGILYGGEYAGGYRYSYANPFGYKYLCEKSSENGLSKKIAEVGERVKKFVVYDGKDGQIDEFEYVPLNGQADKPLDEFAADRLGCDKDRITFVLEYRR